VSIAVDCADEPQGHAAIGKAFEAVERVQGAMSVFEPQSDISKLYRDGERAMSVDSWTYEVLSLAKRLWDLSDGAFDATAADENGSSADIELLDGGNVRLRQPVRIDLGGIAKGFAADMAAQFALDSGAAGVVVNAGGDLRIRSENREPVYVRDPFENGRYWLAGHWTDGAVASSFLAQSVGVTVAAPSAAVADALTKVVAFADAEVSARVLETFGAKAWVRRSQ
jgi:thiamine biosynthesis lipoprotein